MNLTELTLRDVAEANESYQRLLLPLRRRQQTAERMRVADHDDVCAISGRLLVECTLAERIDVIEQTTYTFRRTLLGVARRGVFDDFTIVEFGQRPLPLQINLRYVVGHVKGLSPRVVLVPDDTGSHESPIDLLSDGHRPRTGGGW